MVARTSAGLPAFFGAPFTGAVLGSTRGIPKRAARALRFSSSISSGVRSVVVVFSEAACVAVVVV